MKKIFIKTFLEKKILAKLFLQKGLVRKKIDKNFLLDSNHSLSILKPRSVVEDLKSIGDSSPLFFTLYENTLQKRVFFLFSTSFPNYQPQHFLKKFNNSLLALKQKNIFLNLFIMRPLKGGFKCYSNGFIGFLSKTHYLFCKKYLYKQKKLGLLLSKILYFFPVPVVKAKVCLSPATVFSNFNKSPRDKKVRNYCHIIFLTYVKNS